MKHGLFDGVDAAIIIHPAGKTGITSPFLAVDPLDFHFYGKSAHAAAAPEQGVNALDGVIQLFNGINALRQQLPTEVKIHESSPMAGKRLTSFLNMHLPDFTLEQQLGNYAKRYPVKYVLLLKGQHLPQEARLKSNVSKMKYLILSLIQSWMNC